MLRINQLFYRNQKTEKLILDDINLDFFNGQLTAILGKSGSGKTTLFRLICFGYKKNKGNIYFNNEEINNKNLKRFRNNIGIVSQKPQLIETLNVYDNLKLEMSNKNKWYKKIFNIISYEQKKEIYEILKSLEMEEKAFTLISDLSGGEAQKIELAKLIIKRPKIVLADEPTSNLDLVNSQKILSIIKKIIVDNNAIGLINIHDISLLDLNLIDKVVGIKDSKIEFAKDINDIDKKILRNLYV